MPADADEPARSRRIAEAVHGRLKPRSRARPAPSTSDGRPRPARAHPSPASYPGPTAQPSEPIFFPKLQIQFADFPYLHCFYRLEAVHLGDLLRYGLRPGTKFTPSPWGFQGPTGAHRTRARAAVLYGAIVPISGRSRFQ
nr:FAM117B-like protein; partial [Biomphalaria glabrata]